VEEDRVLLKPKEVAEQLGISTHAVYHWIRRGWLTSVKLPNGSIRVLEVSVKIALENKIKTGV
jgi:excisionase family DNA binding protein